MEAGMSLPSSFHVLGRPAPSENSDICGEYVRVDDQHSRLCYQQKGTGTALIWHEDVHRWVITRHGFSNPEICVAYAVDHHGLGVTSQQLEWRVWQESSSSFEPATEMAAVDAPSKLVMIGSSRSSCHGEYKIAGIYHGKAYFQKSDGSDFFLRYHQPEARWLLSRKEHFGQNLCVGFGEAVRGVAAAQLPCHEGLSWHFFEENAGFRHDPNARAIAAPCEIQILGRNPQAVQASINGSYVLAGVHEGRPLYVKPGTQTALRYSAKNDMWLIDCEAFKDKPGVIGRFFHWLTTGVAFDTDRCNAFCQAGASTDPAKLDLEWQVLESGNRFIFDPAVRCSSAPRAIRIEGREEENSENGDIGGNYDLVGLHLGWPAYQKRGSQLAVRYWPQRKWWIIDRGGIRDSQSGVAYAKASPNAQHPAEGGTMDWQVFVGSRASFQKDPAIRVVVPPEAMTSFAEDKVEEPAAKRQRLEASRAPLLGA
eukprot:TRINITY_DN19519_c0_g1_i1.p1 TRINITY_DN19519_c0_g1~~TRINITY_DN19519_c0_g1_i1.p1  ORF type:complete len:491 (+),score=87.42 TRINITY_DN19519_c0_g1_i1:33-1475(+)